MSEKVLRNTFIISTLIFLIILGVVSADTLSQVRNLRTPPLTADVIAGKDIWQAKNCNDCHTILGIGGYFAPELTKVVARRDPAWISSYLLDPQAIKPGTLMPAQSLTEIQANQLVSFFQWIALVDTNGWPPAPKLSLGGRITSVINTPIGVQTPKITDTPNVIDTPSVAITMDVAAPTSTAVPEDPIVIGERVYAQKGCNACHMINGLGGAGPGPDLSTIGSQPYDSMPNDAKFLALFLQDPQGQKPGTTMPRIKMTDAEIEALVAYLISLK